MLAEQLGLSCPQVAVGLDGSYAWAGFAEFLRVYDAVGRVIRRADHLRLLAEHYLCESARQGTLYAEFMLSPQHSIDNGISYRDQLAAVAEGVAAAHRETNIDARLIVTCVRHNGPDEALRIAELVASEPNPLVVGFGMTGDERQYDAALFAPAFRLAREAGLACSAHAGEWLEAASVIAAVDALGLARIGHGIRAAEDPGVVRELAARGIGFELCLSSNARLGASPIDRNHALLTLRDAGCRITLATDDPAYFATSPAREYALAQHHLDLSDDDLTEITGHAILVAFCGTDTKAILTKAAGMFSI
jgi:adenosine deaminase